MKILIYSFLDSELRDGASLSTFHLVREFLDRGNQVTLVTYGRGNVEIAELSRYQSFRHARFVGAIHHPLEPSWALLVFLRRELLNADVFLMRGLYSCAALYFAWMWRKSKVFFAINPLGNLPQPTRPHSKSRLKWLQVKFFSRLISPRLLRACDLVICASAQESERVRQIAPGAKSVVIENGVAVPERIEAGIAQRPYALFLGRIAAEKNIEFLLALWQREEIRALGLNLKIVGSVADAQIGYLGQLRDEASRRELEQRVTFEGGTSGAEKERILAGASVLLLPSYFESFGNVVLESLAVGVPVVVSVNTCWQELTEQDLGSWLPLDQEAWIGEIRRWARIDSVSRNELGRRGKNFVESRYSWTKIGEKYLAQFDAGVRAI